MATSGSIETSAVEGRSLIFSWNRTSINVANNTSTIAWSVKGGGSYTGGYVICGDIDVVVNGTTVYNSGPNDRINVWSGTVVASGTATIPHNADGTKSFSASVVGAVYNYAQNVSRSYTWTLDTIPRASIIDKVANTSGTSIATLNTGNDVRVYFTPKSTAFKYRITVSMNGNSTQNNSAGVTPSSTAQQYYQVNIPHTWLSNKESDTLICKLETLNGSSVIGTDNWPISMVVPASIVPTIGTVTSTPINSSSVINGWGIYVANYSKARITCSASGSNGSTISKFQISGDATAIVNGSSLSYDINLSSSGTKTFAVKAIDTRGRSTGNTSVTINVVSYSTPAIQSFNVIRCDANGNINAEGTSAKLSFVGYYSAIGSNAATASFAYKLASASTFAALTNSATGSGGSINGNIISSTFAISNEYDLKITIQDSLGGTVERTVRLNSVARTLNIAKYGNGVAIGKMSTVSTSGAAGKFECGWDASFDKTVNIDGILNANKNIYMGGSKGQTSGLSIVFSNPDSSENPHNSYLYGGNPTVKTAIGCWDNKNGRNIWNYNDVDNNINIGADARIAFNGNVLATLVVEDGSQGEWQYRKWSNGRAECWRTVSVVPTNLNNGVNTISMDLPFTFAGTNYSVQITAAKAGHYIGGVADCNASGNVTHSTTSFTVCYRYTFSTAYTVNFNITINGRWK